MEGGLVSSLTIHAPFMDGGVTATATGCMSAVTPDSSV